MHIFFIKLKVKYVTYIHLNQYGCYDIYTRDLNRWLHYNIFSVSNIVSIRMYGKPLNVNFYVWSIIRLLSGLWTKLCNSIYFNSISSCKVVETEIHFLLEWPMYEFYTNELFSKIVSLYSYVKEMLPINKFTYLMTSSDAQIFKWVGQFVHLSFIKRVNIMKMHTSIWGFMHIWVLPNAVDIVSRIHERISIWVCCYASDFRTGTLIAAIWRCREVFSRWKCGFRWKLCCCWLEG